MRSNSSAVSVVIASLNEEGGIGPTLEELRKVLDDPHLLVIDGNSSDRTVEIAKDLGADVIVQKGSGKGLAIFQGLQNLSHKTRYVVFTDADFTYPATYVPKMVDILDREPEVGMVIGDRFDGKLYLSKYLANPFYAGNRFIAIAQHMLNGIKLNDPLSGLRVVRAGLIANQKLKSKGFDVEAEMNFIVERKGYRIVEIPIDYRVRIGEKKLKIRHGFEILKRIFIESLAM